MHVHLPVVCMNVCEYVCVCVCVCVCAGVDTVGYWREGMGHIVFPFILNVHLYVH